MEKTIERNYSEGIQWYNKALELDPQHDELYRNRGIARHCMQDYEGAVQDYTKSIELNPSFAQPYIYRAMIYFSWNKRQEACKDLRAAYNLGTYDVIETIQAECP